MGRDDIKKTHTVTAGRLWGVCGCLGVWGGGFQRKDSFRLREEANKHTAAVEGYPEIIKSCTLPVYGPLAFIANVKLPDYILWKLGCQWRREEVRVSKSSHRCRVLVKAIIKKQGGTYEDS